MSALPESNPVAPETAGRETAAPDPFFIVGVGRSGTSILAEVLRQHSELHVVDESHLWASLGDDASSDLTVDEFLAALECVKLTVGLHHHSNLERVAGISEQRVFELVAPATRGQKLPLRYILDRLFGSLARERGAVRWGEKTPAHLDHVASILATYPGAKFIYMLRDGRDVAVSLQRDNWGPKTLPDAAYKWQKAARKARAVGGVVGADQWLTVSYEALVADPEEQLHRITDFLGVSFEPVMLTPGAIDTQTAVGFSLNGRTAENLSASFLAWSSAPKAVFFSSSVGSWRTLPPDGIEVLESLMAAELVANGYTLTTSADERLACAARLAITQAADLERRWQGRFDEQAHQFALLNQCIADARDHMSSAREATAEHMQAIRELLATQAQVQRALDALDSAQADQAQLLERVRQGVQRELNRLERRQASSFEALERALRGQPGLPNNTRKYGDL